MAVPFLHPSGRERPEYDYLFRDDLPSFICVANGRKIHTGISKRWYVIGLPSSLNHLAT